MGIDKSHGAKAFCEARLHREQLNKYILKTN